MCPVSTVNTGVQNDTRVHGPWTRGITLDTCVQGLWTRSITLDTRVQGPYPWPVDTGVILDTRVQGCRHDPRTKAVCTALKWTQCLVFPSVVWLCWLGNWKDIWTVEKSVPLNHNGSFSATSGGRNKRTANPVVKTEVGKFIGLLTYLSTGNTVTSVHNWNTDSEENEEFLIALTDAVVNPWTVMIHLLYAPVTYAAATTRNTDLLHYYYIYTVSQKIQTPITRTSTNVNQP